LRWITGGGNPWTARQVRSILTNHTYAGLVVHGFAFRDGCHAVLAEIGAGNGLTTNEQAGVVRGAVRSVVYDAASRMLKVDRIKPPVGAARGSG
jgi:hypothetical protein